MSKKNLNSEGLISVCVTTYNRKKLLPKVLNSILNQTYSNFELLLVDDYSTDGTEQFLKKDYLGDKRIKYIRHKRNKGLAAARNTAISQAKGKYFTFCDDDDSWDETFLKVCIETAHVFPGNSICSGIISGHNLKYLKGSFKNFIMLGYTPPVASQFYILEDLREVAGYNPSIKSGVDHDLWLKLAASKKSLIWINKSMVKVNRIQDELRMTWHYQKRLDGISNSLQIWENQFNKELGNKFFHYLQKNYVYYIHKRFMKHNLRNFRLKFIFFLIKMPFELIVKDCKRFLSTRIFKLPSKQKGKATFFPYDSKVQLDVFFTPNFENDTNL